MEETTRMNQQHHTPHPCRHARDRVHMRRSQFSVALLFVVASCTRTQAPPDSLTAIESAARGDFSKCVQWQRFVEGGLGPSGVYGCGEDSVGLTLVKQLPATREASREPPPTGSINDSWGTD